MSASIASFLRKGTGPKELRSTLRLKIGSIGALLQALSTLKSMRAEVPRSVLGGDLLGLLSDRMRALLQNEEQSPVTADVMPVRRSRFSGQNDFVRQPESPFSLSAEREKGEANRFATLTSLPQGHGSIPALPASHSIVSSAEPFTPPQFQETSRSELQSAPMVPGLNHNPLSSSEVEVTVRRQSREAARSLLAKKLQEYWELSKPQQPSEKASSQTTSTEAKSKTPATTHPPWHPTTQAPRSWPELTAQQVAQRIRSLGASTSSSRVLQTVNSNPPEKVEIQNVFNIEVKAGAERGTGSADDLSERIADILGEQALQHGIDIT